LQQAVMEAHGQQKPSAMQKEEAAEAAGIAAAAVVLARGTGHGQAVEVPDKEQEGLHFDPMKHGTVREPSWLTDLEDCCSSCADCLCGCCVGDIYNGGDEARFWLPLRFIEDQHERDGAVQVSLQLVPVAAAELNPVGPGRTEPNLHPELPEPASRFDFSFINLVRNPFGSLYYFLGPSLMCKLLFSGCLSGLVWLVLVWGPTLILLLNDGNADSST
jgi:hypothetical protein